jgi:anti-sigma factor RsiW
VKCEHAEPLVVAYADGEVAGLSRHSVEKHLRTCARCAAKHAEVLALRVRLRAEVPYFAPPPGFRERMRESVRSAPRERSGTSRSSRVRWPWLGGGALAGSAATVLAFVMGTAILGWRAGEDVAAQAVASHTQATLAHRLVEVASSDQHTVKPWLSARLDYSPPVRDLVDEGFPLIGGRLDTLGRKTVATLVYGYRKHTIDVFVQPDASAAPQLRELRGFNVVHAREGGWDWLAVSDASPDVLNDFLQKLLRATAKP